MRWLNMIGAAAVGAATLLALPHAAAQEATLLSYDGPDRQPKIEAAARKEGTLTLYTSISEQDLATLVAPFEKKYGIKVKTWRAGTDKVLQRTLTETAARRHEADIVHISAPEMEALHREKVLQPVNSPHFDELIDGALPVHREWVATLLSVWVQAYNTNLVKKDELPKTYRDLLDPKWNGKLGIEFKNQEWFSTVVRGMGEEAGLKFFRELVGRNGITVRQGHSLLTNMVVSGDVPLALTVYSYMPEREKIKNAPIDWFAIEPAVARANGIGITRTAPHPAAALLFYDYMLTEAQKHLIGIDYIPTNKAMPSPLKGLRTTMVDPAVTLDEMEKWTQLYQDIVVKRGMP